MQNIIKRTLIVSIVIALYLAIAFLIVSLTIPKKGDVIRIDCTWSEISPDFTPEMRKACRNARIGKTT
jgi:hypothetical protein